MATRRERRAIEVHLDAPELVPMQHVGTLYLHDVRTDLAVPFEYARSWLAQENAFLLDPRLDLWAGEQHPPHPASAFGVFLDSAPDRWGRVLMERREAAAAEREQRPMRTLQEVDFLLGVHDYTRMGALRFKQPGAAHCLDNSANAAPPVTDLRELAAISRRIEEPGVERLPEYERWLAMLIAPGTSLGGARPKANFRMPGDELWLAKFPARDDRHDVGGWEFLVHQLAIRAGIWVPAARLEHLTDRYATFCVARFDRRGENRRMYASAMTMLERRDGEEGASYLELATTIPATTASFASLQGGDFRPHSTSTQTSRRRTTRSPSTARAPPQVSSWSRKRRTSIAARTGPGKSSTKCTLQCTRGAGKPNVSLCLQSKSGGWRPCSCKPERAVPGPLQKRKGRPSEPGRPSIGEPT